MSITTGGRVENVDNGIIGSESNSFGNVVTVNGTGSVWTCFSNLFVGCRGSGNALSIEGSGRGECRWLYVGYESSSNSLSIVEGGRVQGAGGSIGAWSNAAFNTAVVSGEGSVWSNSDWLYVGYQGSSNSLSITTGGRVENVDNGIIGSESNSFGNVVTVNGTGSVWTCFSNLFVGCRGSGNALSIEGSGRGECRSGYIGTYPGAGINDASSNTVTVSGAGSVWSNSYMLVVGATGRGNVLSITDGGRVVNAEGTVGYQDTSSGSRVTVSGAGSVWSNSDFLIVGKRGDANALSIISGGLVQTVDGTIGSEGSGSNNTVTVSGTGSVWSNSSCLSVGDAGSGNSLAIINGGLVYNTVGDIGSGPFADNNTVTVSGTGSVWSNSAGLHVGGQPSGAGGTNNSVTVSSGGLVVAASCMVHSKNTIYIGSGGTLVVSGGFTNKAGATLKMDVGGRLEAGGAALLNGTLLLDLGGATPTNGTEYGLFIWGGGTPTGTFTNVQLPDLPPGSTWNTGDLYSSGTLRVDPGRTFYVVDGNPGATPPYTNWLTAATNIQDALDQAGDGDTVLVTNGTYLLSSGISITNRLSVKSVEGPDVTTVDGQGLVRCFHLDDSACIVSGFTITNGSATNVYANGYGGGVTCSGTTPIISNCVFNSNIADWGGGLSGGTAVNCLFTGNAAGSGGGAYESALNSCTLSGNTATNSGGGAYGGTLTNCIVWHNTAVTGTNLAGGVAAHTCSPDVLHGEAGNLTNAPVFLDRPGGDYRLAYTSPCINAGTNQTWMTNAVDLTGSPRIFNRVVDLGAYESLAAEQISAPAITGPVNVPPAGTGETFSTNDFLWITGTKESGHLTVRPLGGEWVTNGMEQSVEGTLWSNRTEISGLELCDTTAVVFRCGSGDLRVLGAAETTLSVIKGGEPLVDVTTEDATVGFEVTEYALVGSSSNLTGTMWATNMLNGNTAAFAASGSWTTPPLALDPGTNPIDICGSNACGYIAMDRVEITRAGAGAPQIIISAETVDVETGVTTYAVSGSNNLHVVGTMTVSNVWTMQTHDFAAAADWTATAVDLVYGSNELVVSGTNALGQTASDLIHVNRLLPADTYVSTNGTHTFPFAGWAAATTNIQDAIDAVRDNGTVWVTNGVYAAAALHIGLSGDGMSNSITIANSGTVEALSCTVYPANTVQLQSGGTLEVSSDLIIQAGATLEVGINSNEDANHGHLTAAESAAVDGTLVIVFLNGSTPSPGDTFDLFDWTVVTGGFAETNLPELSFGLEWDTGSLYTTGELRVEYSTADMDGDGMADGWELKCLNGDALPSDDLDLDSQSNVEEYIAGTHPDDRDSCFRITNAAPIATGFVVAWKPSASNRYYSVNWAPQLGSETTNLVSGIEFPQNSYTDTLHRAERCGFYKVDVRMK